MKLSWNNDYCQCSYLELTDNELIVMVITLDVSCYGM